MSRACTDIDGPPLQPNENERIAILQAMRAIAALAVLMHHAGHAADKYGGPMPLISVTDLGRTGVDLFFVISGFIILHATAGRGRSCYDYVIARVRRIYLPYLPVGLTMAFYVFVWTPHDQTSVRAWVASVTLLPVGQTALNVAWTLQHEVVFYGLVAIGLFSGWWRAGLIVWIAAILLFWQSGIAAPVGFQLIDTEFLMGVSAWAAWKSGHRQTMLATSVALCLLATGMVLIGPGLGIDRSGPIAAAAAFAAILPWLVSAERQHLVATPRILVFLGDASYSIYLVHALPLLFLLNLMTGNSWYVILLAIGGAGLAAGVAYHLLVERPLLRWKLG